jgi:hypothetical protein
MEAPTPPEFASSVDLPGRFRGDPRGDLLVSNEVTRELPEGGRPISPWLSSFILHSCTSVFFSPSMTAS